MFRPLVRFAGIALLLVAMCAVTARAEGRRPLLRRVFPYGFRTEHPDNPNANPYTNTRYWYPKYYGSIHYRDFHRLAYPTGDYPIRGTAW